MAGFFPRDLQQGVNMNANQRVCDSRLSWAEDEELIPQGDCDFVCRTLGADISDHLCEEIESFGHTTCGCACHPTGKQRLRQTAKAGA
jgi:hypothetical protein